MVGHPEPVHDQSSLSALASVVVASEEPTFSPAAAAETGPERNGTGLAFGWMQLAEVSAIVKLASEVSD